MPPLLSINHSPAQTAGSGVVGGWGEALWGCFRDELCEFQAQFVLCCSPAKPCPAPGPAQHPAALSLPSSFASGGTGGIWRLDAGLGQDTALHLIQECSWGGEDGRGSGLMGFFEVVCQDKGKIFHLCQALKGRREQAEPTTLRGSIPDSSFPAPILWG